MRIYFLGPEGTNGHDAASRAQTRFSLEATLQACQTNADAVMAFFRDEHTAFACVPIENSIQGAVTQTWDTLTAEILAQRDSSVTSRCGILAVLTMSIHHYPIYHEGTDFTQVKWVYSHPQALAQTQAHLSDLFPNAQTVAVNSTAEAVRVVRDDHSRQSAAVASRQAAILYGLHCGDRPIEDRAGNVTRFALMGRLDLVNKFEESAQKRVDEVVSVCLRGVAHQPGGLVGALLPFAEAGLNLARLESRPVGDQLGNYVFYVDVSLKGEPPDKRVVVQNVITALRARGTDVVELGSYPVYEND